jgi:hypothetical protein
MNCTAIKQRLVELLYDELNTEDQQTIEKHLDECEACRVEWDALRVSRNQLNQLKASENLPQIDVLAILRKAAVRSEQCRRRWKRTAIISGTVVALLFISVVSQLHIQIHTTRIVIGWTQHPVEQPAALLFADPWQSLKQHNQRLDSLDELANVTAREFLQSDQQRVAELVRLRRQLENLRHQTTEQLNHLQVQSDLRWRLIQYDLLPQNVNTVSLNSTVDE